MAWVAAEEDGREIIFRRKPIRVTYPMLFCKDKEVHTWESLDYGGIYLPTGSIKKLVGRDMRWEDEPVEL